MWLPPNATSTKSISLPQLLFSFLIKMFQMGDSCSHSIFSYSFWQMQPKPYLYLLLFMLGLCNFELAIKADIIFTHSFHPFVISEVWKWVMPLNRKISCAFKSSFFYKMIANIFLFLCIVMSNGKQLGKSVKIISLYI